MRGIKSVPKMKFNCFYAITFIVNYINFSIDIILQDRFTEERLREQKKARDSRANQRDLGKSPAKFHCPPDERRKNETLVDKVIWLLDYNRLGLFPLLLVVVHIFNLLFVTTKSILFSVLDKQRDPRTKEYLDPAMRFLEEHYLFDHLFPYNHSTQYNMLNAVMMAQFLINRLRSLYLRFESARINKYQYSRINTIQLNIAYTSQFMADFATWWDFFKTIARHRCQIGTRHTITRAQREFARHVKTLDKIDQVYYYNLIDFDECFKEAKNINDMRPPEVWSRHNDTNQAPQSFSGRIWATIKFVFSLQRPNRRHFLTQPVHRADPVHLFVLFVLYSFLMVVLVTFYVVNVIAMGMCQLEWRYINWTGEPGSIPAFYRDLRFFLASIEGWLVVGVICVNVADNGLLVMSSMFCQSRAYKVQRLLNREVAFYRAHLDRYRARDQDGPTSASSRSYYRFVPRQPNLAGERHKLPRGTDSIIGRSLDGQIGSTADDSGRFIPLAATGDSARLDTTTLDDLYAKSCKEFNENIVYLTDLIEVLVIELNDLKSYFTFSINLNILFGTIGSALAFSLLAGSRDNNSSTSSKELLLLISAAVANLSPLVFSLFLGATAEGAFRRICRSLMLLMVNESQLVEYEVVGRVQKIHGHLSNINNRAFILLENFPLTFGSLVSILGWIATAILVLQRFFI